MTRTDFTMVLIRLYPYTNDLLKSRISFPKIAEMVAQYCFLGEPEGSDVEALRYQLSYLAQTATFDFSGE